MSVKFDTTLKRDGVSVDERALVCKGASAGQGSSNLQDYWTALCDQPLERNTGRHVVTFRIREKAAEGQSGGWAVVGMAAPDGGKRAGPGGNDNSVGAGSDGTSSVGPSLADIRKRWPKRLRGLAEAADGLQGFGEGDLLRLQLDTRSDAAGRAGETLASTRSVLTIFLNGIEHAGYEGVPDGWHFAVGGHGGVAFEIVEPTKCVIL